MSKAAGKNYFLYHRPTKTTIPNLNWIQTKAMCITITSDQVRHWFIYAANTEYSPWRPLMEVIFDLVKDGRDNFRYDVPPVNELEWEEKELKLEDLSSERRDSPRFKRELEIILDLSGHLVPAKTEDISLSGVKLASVQQLEGKPKYLMALVKTKSKVLSLKLSPVYIDEEGRFQALICIGCSDSKLWKSQQTESVS